MLRALLLARAVAALHHQPEVPEVSRLSQCILSVQIRPWTKSIEQIEAELGPCLEATFNRLCVGLLSDVRGGARWSSEGEAPHPRSVVLTDVFKTLAAHSGMHRNRARCNSEEQVHFWLGFVEPSTTSQEVYKMNTRASHLKAPFILVAPGDVPMPAHTTMAEHLLLSGQLRGRMFAWNPAFVHPHLKPYPVGITGGKLKLYNSSYLVKSLRGKEASLSHRASLLACHGVGHEGFCARGRKIDELEALGHNCRRGHRRGLPWPEYIGSLAGSKLAISPAGTVMQNHRDYEVAMSGAVAVFDDSTRHPVWEPLKKQLPAIYVSNWSQLTPAFLEEQWEQVVADRDRYDVRRAFLPFWVDEVLREVDSIARETRPPPAMRVAEKFSWGGESLDHATCCHVKGGCGRR